MLEAVEFTGSLKAFHEVCKLLGNDPIEHFYDWKQMVGGNELDIVLDDTIYHLKRGDVIMKQNGDIKIVECTKDYEC